MEITLAILVTGALCMACFFIGAKIGQTASRGEPIKAPEINPVKVMQEMKANREDEAAKKERERLEIILQNIENYDGTEIGQTDVPM